MSGGEDREVRKLLDELDTGDRHARAEAAIELGQRGIEAALPTLETLAGDPDDLVAVAAIYGAWHLGGERLPLERAAASLGSDDEEILQTTVHALCEIGDDAVPALLALVEAGSAHSERILRVLGDIDTERSRAALEELSRSSDPELARAAAQALEP